MATQFDIQVRNGVVSITVGGQSSSTDGSTGGNGKSSGTASGGNGKSSGTGSGGNGKSASTASGGAEEAAGDCCCAPVVIGPIVISGGGFSGSDGSLGGNGKSSGTASGGNGKSASTASGGNGKSSGTGSGGDGKSSSTASGGGSTHGGCCCAPVVIGPIVISGCSGMGTASDPAAIGPGACGSSTAVSVNPPTGPVDPVARPFTMQIQEETYWCWAAVAVSINAFLNPPPATQLATWTQPTLATQVLATQLYPPVDCANDPNQRCDRPARLDVALTITQNLRPSGALFGEHLTFESLQSWIAAQLPVGARIQWCGGGAHFIALYGCKVSSSGRQFVYVLDPSPTANASPGCWDYDALVEDYEQAGFWDDTYLVTANIPN